ncbi:YdhR family protein, partial [Vibrio parahaemolyticus]|uniref:YdhR family protein n=1 Tax=Vibrio parahaemolyticus TaxID=670 RepID=UPI0015867A75
MVKLLQVDFEFHGPFGEELSTALVDLAKPVNQEPGMIWKIWTESEKEQLGGGIHLFDDEAT